MTQVAREEGQAVGMQSFIPDHSHLKKNFPFSPSKISSVFLIYVLQYFYVNEGEYHSFSLNMKEQLFSQNQLVY